MGYPIMEPPFILVLAEEMNKKQAEQYFQWYMTQIDSRIKQLEEYAQKENQEVILDKTPESLIPLWEWFEDHIEYEDKTEEEMQNSLIGQPEWFKEILLQNTRKLTIPTLAFAEDISIYFAETVIHNNKEIYWSYTRKPKKLDGVNRPILHGFHKDQICVNQRRLISVCISKSAKENNKNRLYDLYGKWEKNV